MITRMTHDRFKHIVSTDGLRPAMQGVYYEPDKKRLTATNGHLLLSIEADEVEPEDIECILPLAAFDHRGVRASANQRLKITFEKRPSGVLITTESHRRVPKRGQRKQPETLSRRITHSIEEAFPDYQAVIDKAEERLKAATKGPVELGLSLELLDAVRKSLPFKKKGLRIQLDSNANRPTMIRRGGLGFGDEPLDFVFIVMPMALDTYDSWDA